MSKNPDCRRYRTAFRPGETVPGFKCSFSWLGSVPNTGQFGCVYCGRDFASTHDIGVAERYLQYLSKKQAQYNRYYNEAHRLQWERLGARIDIARGWLRRARNGTQDRSLRHDLGYVLGVLPLDIELVRARRYIRHGEYRCQKAIENEDRNLLHAFFYLVATVESWLRRATPGEHARQRPRVNQPLCKAIERDLRRIRATLSRRRQARAS